jgi:hypothetical protein
LLDEDVAERSRLVEKPRLHAGEELLLLDDVHCSAIIPKTRFKSDAAAMTGSKRKRRQRVRWMLRRFYFPVRRDASRRVRVPFDSWTIGQRSPTR